MPKYLCKTTLKGLNGDIIFQYGFVYEGDIQLDEGMSIHEVVLSGESDDGSHNAFELVKVEWPEPVELGSVDMKHENRGVNVMRLCDCSFVESNVKKIHEFTGKWLEAAESEAGE